MWRCQLLLAMNILCFVCASNGKYTTKIQVVQKQGAVFV